MASSNRGLPSQEILKNNFTETEAQTHEFSASYHVTASSATPAKVVQSQTAIDIQRVLAWPVENLGL